MKVILDPNLVLTVFGKKNFEPNYGVHPWKWLIFDAH